MPESDPHHRPARRLAWAAVAAVTVLAVAIGLGAGPAGVRSGGLNQRYAFAQNALSGVKADKNAISRAGEFGRLTQDPTTAQEKAAAAAYVERERALPDPELTSVPVMAKRRVHPQDRYALANGCYTLTARR